MKLMWTGSCVLSATQPVRRIKMPYYKWHYMIAMYLFAKIADLFVQEHYVVSEHLSDELRSIKLRKPIKVLADPPKSFKSPVREPHDGFNVLFYLPGYDCFRWWLYGGDIYEEVSDRLFQYATMINPADRINVFVVDGDTDMEELYPVIDYYVRCNRHDGNPRMIMECEQFGIPYYWSKSKPDVDKIVLAIKAARYNKMTNHKSNNTIDD